MLEKRGVPDTIKYSLAGCLVINKEVYVPLEEVAKLCRKFHTSPGSASALALTQTRLKTIREGVPEVLIISKSSFIGKILSKLMRGSHA